MSISSKEKTEIVQHDLKRPVVESIMPKTINSSSFLDKLCYTGFLGGGLVIACFLGMLCAILNLPPFQMTLNAMTALKSLHRQSMMAQEELPQYLWSETAEIEKGVSRNSLESEEFFTLYGSAHESSIILINADGDEVHRWHAPFQSTWKDATHIDTSLPENYVHIRRGHLFENGDLLALYETPLHTPNGIGLAKLDVNGGVIWTFNKKSHHDFDIADDGKIYVLTHRVLTQPLPEMPFLPTPLIEDCLSVLDEHGHEIKTFSLMASFGRSKYCRPRTIKQDAFGDSFHSNSANIVTTEFAKHHDGIEPGDVMICARDLNLVFVVNVESEEIVWATTGPWHHPHDPDPLPNGNILIFDNCFARGNFSGSRVIEFDPRLGELVWEFAGNHTNEFCSDVRACQQLLSNGHVLITESVPGRLREINRAGEVVWEYVNPIRGGVDDGFIPIIVGGQRVDLTKLTFLNNFKPSQGVK